MKKFKIPIKVDKSLLEKLIISQKDLTKKITSEKQKTNPNIDQELKKQNAWINFINNLKRFYETLTNKDKEIWREFILNEYKGYDENTIQSIFPSKENTELKSKFLRKYNQFKPYLSDTFFPDNEQEVTDIRTIISELNDINQKFDTTQQDEEIKRFFDNVREGNADLTLLTEKVLSYLKEENLLDKLIIRSKLN